MKSPHTYRVEISNTPENSSSYYYFFYLIGYAAVTGAAYPQTSRGFQENTWA